MKQWKDTRDEKPSLRLVERDTPNSMHAEQVVLGTLIAFPEKIEHLIDVLRPADFYSVRHRVLYEEMLAYYRKHSTGADFLTLAENLHGRAEIGADELVELMHLHDELWSVDLMADVRLILGTSSQRTNIAASGELATIGYTMTDPDEARAAVEKLLYDLASSRPATSDFVALNDVLMDCMTDIEYATQHRGHLLGVTTGFTDLNLLTNGLQRTDLILLAARPGGGKTSLGMGIGYNAAKSGKTVAVFSLEMGKKQLGTRLLSLTSRVPSNRLKTGWIDEDEMERLVKAHDHLGDLPIYIDDTAGSPISSITSKLRRLRAKIHKPIDLVIVDYLQLMEDENESAAKRENRNQELSKISRGLKLIAREFDVPVLALAQLSRAVESRASKVPLLSDLRDSGALEQDADIVMFIYRDEMYNAESERKGLADVIIAKHRNGPVGQVTLAFNSALTRFDNCEMTPTEDEYGDE